MPEDCTIESRIVEDHSVGPRDRVDQVGVQSLLDADLAVVFRPGREHNLGRGVRGVGVRAVLDRQLAEGFKVGEEDHIMLQGLGCGGRSPRTASCLPCLLLYGPGVPNTARL